MADQEVEYKPVQPWAGQAGGRLAVKVKLTGLGDRPIEIGMPVDMVTRCLRQDGDERGMLVSR
jgi:hypothetical protein